jgi:hypothetical protein
MKDEWDHKKSTLRNLKEMGLANDPNKAVKIPNFKQEQLKKAKKNLRDINSDTDEEEEEIVKTPIKVEVMQKLEKEAKAPRERKFM